MKVENHTGRITKIPIMEKSVAGHIAEKASILLLPGVNEVDPALWAEAKKIALVQMLLEAGYRKGGLVEGDPKISLKTLDGLKEKDAITIVEETVDVKLLERWSKLEKREPVLLKIAEQFKAIDPSNDKVKGFPDGGGK